MTHQPHLRITRPCLERKSTVAQRTTIQCDSDAKDSLYEQREFAANLTLERQKLEQYLGDEHANWH